MGLEKVKSSGRVFFKNSFLRGSLLGNALRLDYSLPDKKLEGNRVASGAVLMSSCGPMSPPVADAYWLTDEQFERIESTLSETCGCGRPYGAHRKEVNDIF
ncbi:hypothetical protein GGQ08_003194 [Salinibacter ruber]|nr:hypothetical protein [Salinibacter ruber]MCS3655103.1 hypothetical protein [Salinibacter ruber]